jgi:hypothetical protein
MKFKFDEIWCYHGVECEDGFLLDAAWCSLINIDRRFSGVYYPDDGGSKHVLYVGQYLADYTAQHPRGQPSSSSNLILSDVSKMVRHESNRYMT